MSDRPAGYYSEDACRMRERAALRRRVRGFNVDPALVERFIAMVGDDSMRVWNGNSKAARRGGLAMSVRRDRILCLERSSKWNGTGYDYRTVITATDPNVGFSETTIIAESTTTR